MERSLYMNILKVNKYRGRLGAAIMRYRKWGIHVYMHQEWQRQASTHMYPNLLKPVIL